MVEADTGGGITPGVYYSRSRLRPTSMSKSLTVAVVFVVVTSLGSSFSYGFILILIGLAVADALLSRWALRARDLEISNSVTVAEAPDRLEFAVAAKPGVAALRYQPQPFSALDFNSPETVVIPAKDGDSHLVHLAIGNLPSAKRYMRLDTTLSILGLVDAHRVALFASPMLLYRIPELPQLDDPIVAQSVDEVGRLRPYVPGDRRSRVAWPTTARTGQLHVRDSSVEEGGDVVVVLDLGSLEEALMPPAGVDPVVQVTTAIVYAGVIIRNFLDQGINVTLCTAEVTDDYYRRDLQHSVENPTVNRPVSLDRTNIATKVVQGVVTNREELIRRLACADAGMVTCPPGPHIVASHEGLRAVS